MITEPEEERPSAPATERAEQMLDRVGERVGRYASLAGLRLRRMAAVAREEAEDVWAEAESVRRRERP